MTAPGAADDEVRAELARAFGELSPHMVEHARQDADLDPTSRPDYPPFPVGGTSPPVPTTAVAGRR